MNELDKSDKLDGLDESDGGSVVLRERASLRGGHELQARASGVQAAILRQQCKLASAVRGTSYKLALAVKFRLLMMIGFVFEDCKGSVELFYKK